jgi:deazaflavin-dependent oxidoreductase (nitroreductase family)
MRPTISMSGGAATSARGQVAAKRPPLINRLMGRLLVSHLSWLVDRSVMLLTVHGRRTGRTYTFPVQYVQDDSTLWVYVGDEAAKTWWRNLLGGAKVQVLLRRDLRAAAGIALRQAHERELVEEGLRRYTERFPRTARRLDIHVDDAHGIGARGSETVMVRIRLTSDEGAEAPDEGVQATDRGSPEVASPLLTPFVSTTC